MASPLNVAYLLSLYHYNLPYQKRIASYTGTQVYQRVPNKIDRDITYRVCHIFRLTILTTFKLNIVFRCSWDSSVNWLKPKIVPPEANLACTNP